MKRSILLILLVGAWLSMPAAADQVSLGVEQAIALAIQSNLKTRLAQEKTVEKSAMVEAAESAYRPTLSLNGQQFNRSVNLAAQGLSGSSLPVPTRIGPFYSFDSRLELIYKIYDATRKWGVRSRELELKMSEIESDIERRTVTVMTSAAYLELLEAKERDRVAQIDVELAQRLVKQATDLENNGLAAGVDVTRAETRLAERQLELYQNEEDIRAAQRKLLRITGLPLSSELKPTDPLLDIPNPFPSLEEALAQAQNDRLELNVANQQMALAEAMVEQARSEKRPTVNFVADAGLGGNALGWNTTFVHNLGITVNWRFYDGGRADAEMAAARSRVEQARLQLDDLKTQVENDVRDAYSILQTAEQSKVTAKQAVDLATQELEMSRDRFDAGLTDNVEVLASEAALTRARFKLLESVANYDLGLIRLASASGQPEVLLEAFRRTVKEKGAQE